MGKYFKYLFFTYVILLAGYATYKNVMHYRLGLQKASMVKPQKECHALNDWKYCVFTTNQTNNDVTLYYFHGKDDDEEAWMNESNFTGLLQEYWSEKGGAIPRVVSVSFGPVWLVTPKMSKEVTGLLDRFITEVFPTIESKHGKPKRRFLLGESMGGLNAATIALHFPKQFSKVALLCPILYKISPFSDIKALIQFAARSGAKPKSLLTTVALGRHFFINESEWKAFNPIERISSTDIPAKQEYYVSTGMRDEFGVYEGAKIFVNRLRYKNIKTLWRPNSGDHCSVDVISLGDFLSI